MGFSKDKVAVFPLKLSEKHEVQKTNPLFSLWASNLTLSEMKLLDIYLSRVNSRNSNQREVVFYKGELENVFGVDRIRREDLDARISHLHGAAVELSENGRVIDKINLFERSRCVQDTDGKWYAMLTCTVSAMKYIFNAEKIGYFRYKLKNILKLESIYSYLLFNYLEYNRSKKRKTWRVTVEELRNMLRCDEKLYEEFKYFNQRILSKCCAEINEKTAATVEYRCIRNGRKVCSIEFTIGDIDETFFEQEIVDLEEQKKIAEKMDFLEQSPFEYSSDDNLVLAKICEFSFDDLEISNIAYMLNDTDFKGKTRETYLARKYKRLKACENKYKIDNRFEYFLRMLETETRSYGYINKQPALKRDGYGFVYFSSPEERVEISKELLPNIVEVLEKYKDKHPTIDGETVRVLGMEIPTRGFV